MPALRICQIILTLHYYNKQIGGIIMGKTIFNEAQQELLSAMASLNSEEDLKALKHTISEFFARRADKEMEKLWQDGTWNEQTLKDLKNAHYRTPYKQ